MDEMLPTKVSSIEELNEINNRFNLEFENKWKFIIDNKNTYPNYHGIYKEEGNYIVYFNKYDGTTEKLYVGNNENKATQILWTRFLDEVYKSNDVLKEKIPSKFIKTNQPSEKKKIIRNILIFIGCIVGIAVCIKLVGISKLLDYWTSIV